MSDPLESEEIGRQSLVLPVGDVVCFGFLTYLLLLSVETFPQQNGGAPILGAIDSLGDDAAIIACTLSRWKVHANLISSTLADDYYGQRVLEQLSASGLTGAPPVQPGQRTPLEVAIVDTSGSRTYFQRREPRVMSSLTAPTAAQLSGARMLYVDWYDGPEVLVVVERARSLEVPVFVNLESRYVDNPQLIDILGESDICQISLDEPQAIRADTGAAGQPTEIARSLLDRGVGTVLITMGSEGCAVAQPGQAYSIRPPKVRVIDGYGAGAAFSAGVIHGILQGWPLSQLAQFATAHASLQCGVTGNADFSIEHIQGAATNLEIQAMVL